MREKYYLGSRVMISNAKKSPEYTRLACDQSNAGAKRPLKTTIMVDSTIKGTTYEGENREKKRGIYEKRKTKKGGGRKNRE